MSGRTVAIGAVAVLVAFGAAFGIGKATAPKEKSTTQAAAPTPVEAFQASSTAPQLASYDPAGSLPAPKKQKKKATKKPSGGGGGAPATPATPSTPSTPSTQPTPPAGGGGGGGGGGRPPSGGGSPPSGGGGSGGSD
jgi:hypothetical protein